MNNRGVLAVQVDAAFERALAKSLDARPKDIELWCASFVELLEEVVPAPATAGWSLATELSPAEIASPPSLPPTLRFPGKRD